MSELTSDFQSLPEEYQKILRLAQDTHRIIIAPLQLLVGGWSGAVVYLVSVSYSETKRVEHCILKLDRKSKNAKSDEVTRHNAVVNKSTPEFTREHIADLVFERVELDGTIAIFYRIAGQSLLNYLPLSKYERQNQLKALFAETNTVLLNEWNANRIFEQAVHPQKVLQKWLSFRLDAGGNIEKFLQDTCQLNPDITGLLINGHVFPNPLSYARKPELWNKARAIDIATGFIHGDLNTNNILVKFTDHQDTLEGYYLIDFALFKENSPLLYDQRYLEMSYLIHALSQVSFAKCVNFLTLLAVADIPDPYKVPIEMSGVSTVIAEARSTFAAWVQANHPSLHDDLWGQYWLAGVAAGLTYCHKVGMSNEQRLIGLIYACINLRRYTAMFNLSLPTSVELLYDENQAGKDSRVASTTKKPRHNLPAQTTPFIGRTTQITVLKELILKPDVHLVTLLGPGGTGKTRLSLQVAHETLENFPNGVFFVQLADDTDSNQLVSRVAQQLEVREGGRPLLENVKDYLRDKNILLVLDNFEQLISASPVVADLLTAAPQLKIITSSRSALQLHGEREYPVPPLDLPPTGNVSAWENLVENESILLFVGRAQAVHPNFSLTKDNASAVAEICRRLDGLPLALELAAARIKLLPPQAILTRLDDSLKLLTGGARDLPSRHQTLRNTIEWSYGLLNEDEKKLYMRLSVFVGGFTLEAAEAVCNAEKKLDILEGVTSLVNNSLVRQDDINGEPRFGMLETIRAFALERLAESKEKEALQASQAEYFGNIIMDQAGLEVYSSNSQRWLNWFEQELDNIRAALNWGLTVPQGLQLGAGLIFMLFWFWYRRGYFIEGQQWAEKFLSIPAVQNTPPLRALALASSGMMALWQGQQEIALAKLQETLTIEQRLEDDRMVAISQMANGIAFINMGRDSDAEPLLEAASQFLEIHNPYFHALTLVHLGNAELGLGHPDKAHAYHSKAEVSARQLHENWLLSFALNNLGEVARTQGQYELARKYYEECEALLPDSSDTGDRARFVHSLGYIAQHEGDHERADSQFRKSLKMFRQLGNRRGMAECMAGLAGLKARQGNTEWAAIMLSAAESALKATGGAWWPADRVEVEANQEIIRLALSEGELTAAQKKGKAMTLEQALVFAAES